MCSESGSFLGNQEIPTSKVNKTWHKKQVAGFSGLGPGFEV